MRQQLAVAAATSMLAGLVLGAAGVVPASAVVPGRNGYVAYTRSTGGGGENIRVQFRDGTGDKALTTDGKSSSPAWSPNGKKIAYLHGADVNLMTAGGSLIRRLAVNATGRPTWSPDGGKIAFIRAYGAIFTVPVTGGTPTKVLPAPPTGCYTYNVDWAPLGNKLLFTQRCRVDAVMVLNLATKTVRYVTGDGAKGPTDEVESPRWMPDGTHIVFTSLCALTCNVNTRNVVLTDLIGNRQAVTNVADDSNCGHSCYEGYYDVAPGPDGHDFAVSSFTNGGVAVEELSALFAHFAAFGDICCDVYGPDWQSLATS